MKKGEILELEIVDLAVGGRGIAKVKVPDANTKLEKDFVVFVDGAIPGQKIRAKISKKKKRFAEAKLVEILEKSSLEVETGFAEIPGAPWAKLPIEIQKDFKKKQVFDLFKKFVNLDLEPVFEEFVGAPEIWNYRNKMEFSFGPTDEEMVREETLESGKVVKIWEHSGFGFGSKKRGQFWLVENASSEKSSGIFDEKFEKFLPEIRSFCEKISADFPVWNSRTNSGFFRQLTVRKSFFENKFLIDFVTTSANENKFPIKKFVQLLTAEFGEKIGGIFWTKNNSVSDGNQNLSDRKLVFGKTKITEKIGDLEFEISMDSFFQTNVFSAEKLYEKAVVFSEIEKDSSGELILDLFCGTGTIGQIVARKFSASTVFGVEIVHSAVVDAKKNAEKNGLKNVDFLAADVFKFLKDFGSDQFLETFGKKFADKKVSTVFLDPPRGGIAKKALLKIMDFAPEKIIYVSCNPATLARDTEILSKKYTLEKISCVDQFPHTAHIESVVRFRLKK
jgi:23S rRNA (uracil1939-C5)-methyltransferase